MSQLQEPIGVAAGVLWLLAAALVLTTAALLARGAPTWWWAVALGAAVISQAAIVTSWSDAAAGTLVNVLLVLSSRLRHWRQRDRPASTPSSVGARLKHSLTSTMRRPW